MHPVHLFHHFLLCSALPVLLLCIRDKLFSVSLIALLTAVLTSLCCVLTRENVTELQQSHMKEMERALAQLQDELRKKEAEYEEKLLLIRQQQTSKVRCLIFSFYCAFIGFDPVCFSGGGSWCIQVQMKV